MGMLRGQTWKINNGKNTNINQNAFRALELMD